MDDTELNPEQAEVIKEPETKEVVTPKEEVEIKEPEEKNPEDALKSEPEQEIKEAEPESKKEEEAPQDDKVDVTQLLKDIEDKDEQVKTLSDKITEFNDLKVTHKQTADKLASYETVLNTIVEAKLKEIPEDYKDLIPEGDLVKRLDWLGKASEKGLFGNKTEKPIGKKTNTNTTAEKKQPENLTPLQSMSNAFGDFFSQK